MGITYIWKEKYKYTMFTCSWLIICFWFCLGNFLGSPTYALAINIKSEKKNYQELSKTVFIKAVPSKEKIYVGEPVMVTYLLYHHIRLIDPQNEINIAFKNSYFEEYPSKKNKWEEVINGKVFEVIILKKYLVIPKRVGALEISPIKVSFKVALSPSPDEFFEKEQIVEKSFSSKPILPASASASLIAPGPADAPTASLGIRRRPALAAEEAIPPNIFSSTPK